MTIDPFVTQLAGLCRAERTRAKWVFVPTHAIGLTLGDRLAREGCDWANLRFVTPLDIAARMAAPFLLERGIDPSEEQLGPALMMRLLLDLPEKEGYFRPMAGHSSMAEALWRTVRELRYAGLRAKDLPAAAFASTPAKHSELLALLSAYEAHLEATDVADMPIVLEEAVRHQDWCPIAAHDLVTELPDVLWSPLVRRFLDSLPGERACPRAPRLPDVPIPARADRLAAPTDRVDPDTPTDAGRLRFLLSPAAAGPAREDGTLDIFHAGGREAEVDEVLRRLLASGRPLDQVEIACASDAYPLLVWEKATRLGWRVTLSTGVPATLTRPGRLLVRFCDWVANDFAARDLRRLLQSGDAAPKASVGTAHSIHGVTRSLWAHNNHIRIVAVEPAESAVLSGGSSGAHQIEGIGIGFIPPLWDRALVNEVETVSTGDARAMARRLARDEGIFAGTSSGANVVAALRIAARLGRDATVATLIVDSGLRYLSTEVYASGE